MCGGARLTVWIEHSWMTENLKTNLYVEFVFVCLISYPYQLIIREYSDTDSTFQK